MDVASGDRHVEDTAFAAGQRRVDRVFGEDDRVVVGIGDGACAVAHRRLGDGGRRRMVHQAIHVLRFRDVPVLAELAGKIATGGAEGEDRTARVEMVQRLLLDRVDAETGGPPQVVSSISPPSFMRTKQAPALAFMQLAVARAEVALDPAVGQCMPPAARMAAFGVFGGAAFMIPSTSRRGRSQAAFEDPRNPPEGRPSAEVGNECPWFGQLLPDLRQEGRATTRAFQDDTVDARLQPGQCVGLG